MTTYEQLLADCIRWAKEAGRIQLELFRSDRLNIEAKFNDSDVVTNADKASEKAIISEIPNTPCCRKRLEATSE